MVRALCLLLVPLAAAQAQAQKPSSAPQSAAPAKYDPCEDCNDGRGTSLYFRRSDYEAAKGGAVPPPKLFGKSQQSCECSWAWLNRDGKLVAVKSAEFDAAIKAEQQACDNCLLVQRDGWPDFGAVFEVATHRRVSARPSGAHDGEAALEQSDIVSVVLQAKPAIAECVNEQKSREPGKHGTVTFEWKVRPDGTPTDVRVTSRDTAGTHAASCLSKVISGLRFARSKRLSQPITFPFRY